MRTLIALSIVHFIGACAYAPSQAVKDANAAYLRAEQSRASQLAPAELRQAQLAIAQAERADRDDPGGYRASDLAYIATRKSQWAEARGDIEQSKRMQENAEKEIATATGQQLDATKKMLADERQQGDKRVASAQEAAQVQVDAAQAQTDEAKRIAALAETRADEALAEVARLEKVSKDARGQVITLPSGLLFKSGKSILNASARPRLDEVVLALKRIPDRSLLIEGHTDSVGREDANVTLSERRAKAVKDYLVSRGVAAERITIVGAGPSRPIADNSNTEGRAMNRRVEIVVQTPSENTARADQ